MQDPKENESTGQEVEASPKKDEKPVEAPAEPPKEEPSKKSKTKMIEMSTDQLLQWEQRLKELTSKSKKAEKENETLKLELSKAKSQFENNEIKFKDELETRKKAEVKYKNTIEGLEEKNKGFLQMVDEASSKGQIQNGKIKDMELSKDVMAKQLKERCDELVAFQERYKQEGNFEKTILDLKLQNKNLQAKIKELEVQVISHQEKESEEKLKPKIEVVKSESFVKLQSDYEALKLKNSELVKLAEEARMEAEKGQKLNLYLAKEIEELQGEQKKHEMELEEETRSMREDLMKMKKEMGSKEYKFKENERMNEELRSKVLRLEEDIELMANKLRNNSNINKASNSNKKNDKQDMKIVETLVNEKNELKAELNRVGREKNRFEVMVKDMSEILEIKEINIMALANKVCELDMIDRETVLKGLVPEDKERVKNAMHNKSLPDMKQLIEKVIIDNISLKKEINLLKAKKMIG